MSTYFAILTEVGEAKLANAIALGRTLKLKNLAVGDGNGTLPMPVRTQKGLIREMRRASLNQLTVDPGNASQIIVEQVLPEDVGGWWIREIGIFDEVGDLCAVANCPPSYKPLMAEGSGRTQVVRIVLIVASTAAVELKIDPSVILSTRKYVDDQDITVRAYSDAQLAKHLANTNPHPQYSMKEVATLPRFDASMKLVNAEFLHQAQGNMVGFIRVTENRALTAGDVGTVFLVGDEPVVLTFPTPASVGIPYNSGACIHLVGVGPQPVTLLPGGDGAQLAAPDVIPSIKVKRGQSLTLMATSNQLWRVINSTTELWRNADFTPHLANTGSQPLPGGFILQWIAAANAGGNGTAIDTPYDMAFPNAVVAVSAIHIGNDTSVNITVDGDSPKKLASIRLRSNYTLGASVAAYVLAIGY